MRVWLPRPRKTLCDVSTREMNSYIVTASEGMRRRGAAGVGRGGSWHALREGGAFGDGLWETEERGEERPCTGPAISGQWTHEHLCG